jgi:hypothetical protein
VLDEFHFPSVFDLHPKSYHLLGPQKRLAAYNNDQPHSKPAVPYPRIYLLHWNVRAVFRRPVFQTDFVPIHTPTEAKIIDSDSVA